MVDFGKLGPFALTYRPSLLGCGKETNCGAVRPQGGSFWRGGSPPSHPEGLAVDLGSSSIREFIY